MADGDEPRRVVLVTGVRDLPPVQQRYVRRTLRHVLEREPGGGMLIEGDARGVDRLAGEVARDCGWALQVMPADWTQHGRAAGPIRNSAMVAAARDHQAAGAAVEVWAFPATSQRAGSGTWDCVGKARKAGLTVSVVRIDQEVPLRRDVAAEA